MADNVVKLFPNKEDCQVIEDSEHNQNRDDQGPPIGSLAFQCSCQGMHSFAFYMTPSDIRCYHCHKVQTF